MDPATAASWFLPASLVAVVFVAASALALRGRAYATFRGVLLTVYSLIATALLPVFEAVMPAYLYLHCAVFFHSAVLARPRMMPLPYRALVSIPASFFAAGTLLAWPWAVLHAVGFNAWGAWLPHVVAFLGVVQSLSARRAEVDVVVGDGHAVDTVSRHRSPTLIVSAAFALCTVSPTMRCWLSTSATSRRRRT